MDACECNEEEQQRTHIEVCDVQKNETKHTLITNEEEQQTHIEIQKELKFETVPYTLVTDEEEQKNLGHLREEVQELRIKNEHTQIEIQTIKRMLQREVDTSKSSYFNILIDIRYLLNRLRILEEAKIEMQDDIQQLKEHNNRLRILEESKIEMQDDIQQLKEHNNAANISISSLLPQRSPIAMPSILMRNITTSDDGLPMDTFTLLMISRVRSRAWVLGILTFALQMTLIIMIGYSQIKDSVQSSLFDVPFKVDGVVRAGQLLTIVYTLATQNDIISSVRFLIMFWRDPRWDKALLRRHEGAPPPTNTLRVVHILLPNGLKFIQGFLVICITFVVIVQSDNTIDLLKDFTALMAVSETDNIAFWLAVNGYLGSELQQKTIQARDIDIRDEVTATYTNINRGPTNTSTRSRNSDGNDGGFVTRSVILLAIGMAMVGGWLYIVINQLNGKYFYQRYPYCKPPEDQPEFDMFALAKEHFGDEDCYGGPLNTLGCQFEGGDCVNFNLAFPLCKGDDRTNVQTRVGDGKCEKVFMSSDCDYDGGDCCPYEIINGPSFGDGICDEKANFEGCGYDKGDCVDYNRDYSGCPQDVVFGNPLFGNGACHGGIASTKNCSYDNGDCNEFILAFPKCPLDDLSRAEGADDVVIGDGICDSWIYNLEECGYEFGDCNYGQLGQTVSITDDIEDVGHIAFSKVLSLDGMTMALGLPYTNEDGSFDIGDASGLVTIWRYNSIRKIWMQLGNDIVGQHGDNFGYWTGLSANGNRLIISYRKGVRFYDFNITSDDWIQGGQTTSDLRLSRFNGVTAADGLKVALCDYALDTIRIFGDVDNFSDHDVIELVHTSNSWNNQLMFNTKDGSRLLVSSEKITEVYRSWYRFNPHGTPKPWTQIGKDITISSSRISSSTISADGNRIAVSTFHSNDSLGQVDVFDYDAVDNAWVAVGNSIKSSSSSNGDIFGYDIKMRSDGDLLVIASNGPECQSGRIVFDIDKCTAGSIEVYNFHPDYNRFREVLPNPASPFKVNGNVLNLADLISDSAVFGLHFSMDGDGSVLSMSGYNLDDRSAFVKAYDLNEFFYTKCVVDYSNYIGNGDCDDRPPYNSEQCGFDGGDCERNSVEGYPGCFVHRPNKIGNRECDDFPPYNSERCGFDGGDCERNSVEGYPGCFVHHPDWIGNRYCDDYPPYHSERCGFDGGDCRYPVESYPSSCIVPNPRLIGDGWCDDYPPYNSEQCEFDGGDCEQNPVEGYPGCFVHHPDWIGNGICDDFPPYNEEKCGFDSGDCRDPVEGYPGCFIHRPDKIGDGRCDDWPPYNSEQCGFDGGDCERNPVENYPKCFVHRPDKIGDGDCYDWPPYNSEQCGFDGGDCLE